MDSRRICLSLHYTASSASGRQPGSLTQGTREDFIYQNVEYLTSVHCTAKRCILLLAVSTNAVLSTQPGFCLRGVQALSIERNLTPFLVGPPSVQSAAPECGSSRTEHSNCPNTRYESRVKLTCLTTV